MPLERGFNMEHDPANQLPQVAAPRMETLRGKPRNKCD